MPSDRAAARLIALDWGTTSLRAYLLGEGGAILERRAEPMGILQVSDRDFAAVFASITEGWRARDPELPAIASGMIGSAQGWIEAKYVDVPADAATVAGALVQVEGSPLRIVPGIAQRGARPDVMRGEETQIFGALAVRPALARDAVIVLPGTHSKWVQVVEGRVTRFTTYMTGELFAVLRAHSILGRLAGGAAGEDPSEAFDHGVRVARSSATGLAGLLFSARAAALVGDLRAADSLEYLSGLLIGDEVRSGMAAGGRPAALIGEAALCARYARALSELGAGSVEILGDTAAQGLWQIDRRAAADPQRAEGSSRSPVSDRAN